VTTTTHGGRGLAPTLAAGAATLTALLAANSIAAADLMEEYARALESDPTFQSARLEREIADEVLRESKAGVLPLVQASAEEAKVYQEITDSDNLLFVEGKSDFFNQSFTLSLTQPLYRQDMFLRMDQARAEVRQAAAVFTAAEQDLMYRVTEAHFGLLAARDDVEFAVAERIAIQRQLQEAEERLGAGLVPITEVHEVRARFALAEASEIDARDLLEERRMAIAEITGAIPEDPGGLGESFPLVVPDRTDPDAWVEAALFQNPAVKAREAAVEVARGEVRLQRSARLPTLDLVASYGSRDSGDTFGRGGNDIASTDVAIRLAVPVFEGGRVASRTRAATLRQRIRLQELELEKRAVERTTRTAFQGVMSAITRVQALQKSVFSGEAAVASKEEALRSGLDTARSVLDARRELFLARRDLARAHYLYILSGLRLKQAAGTLSVRDLEQINAYLR